MFKLILLLFSINVSAGELNLIDNNAEFSIIGDKTSGMIHILKGTQVQTSAPALYGKELGDSLDNWETTPKTPAGTFELRKAWSSRMNAFILYFIEGKKTIEAIHPVYVGRPKERRVERLENGSNGDERITNGCVNVSPEFFQLLLTIPNNTKFTVLKEGETFTQVNYNSVQDQKTVLQ